MLETSARLLRLLSLLQARRFWTGPELAERLEVTVRTLRRDVDRLRSLGYPVEASSGVPGGSQLGTGAQLPPLLLEDDEAIAVALALQSAASGSMLRIEDAALRAFGKLVKVLPNELRRRVEALSMAIAPLERQGARVDAHTLSVLATACRDREELSFRYRDAKSEVRSRRVEPQGVVHTGARWYLVAWDVGREDWRTFRVDRIEGEPQPGRRFSPRSPPAKDLSRYVADALGGGIYTYRARVLVHAPLERVAGKVPPTVARLEPVSTTTCRMTTGAETLDRLAVHLGLIGEELTIEEPAELRAVARQIGARLRRAAASGARGAGRPTAARPVGPRAGAQRPLTRLARRANR